MSIYNSTNLPTGFYVYAYVRKIDNTPYYIGKGQKRRAWNKDHNVSVPKDTTKIIIMEHNLTELGALALERRYIKWYGRKDTKTGILYNRTDGGDTTLGYVPTEETKRKISVASKGIKRSKEFCDNMSAFRKTFRYSEESKRKMSLAKKGKKLSPEHVEKLRIASTGKPQTEHQKQVLRELRQKEYTITDPDGNMFDVINLAKFCREHNLDRGNLSRSHVKGWTCKRIHK